VCRGGEPLVGTPCLPMKNNEVKQIPADSFLLCTRWGGEWQPSLNAEVPPPCSLAPGRYHGAVPHAWDIPTTVFKGWEPRLSEVWILTIERLQEGQTKIVAFNDSILNHSTLNHSILNHSLHTQLLHTQSLHTQSLHTQ
jgi:hypothetical protein